MRARCNSLGFVAVVSIWGLDEGRRDECEGEKYGRRACGRAISGSSVHKEGAIADRDVHARHVKAAMFFT
jgi:hypothetical protein